MISLPRCLVALCLLATALLVPVTAEVSLGKTYAGDGTYYGYRTRGFGHCSFHFHGFGDSKGYMGTPLAINAKQYTGGVATPAQPCTCTSTCTCTCTSTCNSPALLPGSHNPHPVSCHISSTRRRQQPTAPLVADCNTSHITDSSAHPAW